MALLIALVVNTSAFIAEKLRFITFGFYPPHLHWRADLALALMLVLLAVTAWP